MEDKELQLARITLAQFIILVFVSGGLLGLQQWDAVIVLWVVVSLYVVELYKEGVFND